LIKKSSSSSQLQLKRGSELEPSATSTMSNASISFKSDEDFFSRPIFEMTDKHEMILNNIRKGDEWHQNLERFHGFTAAESCECFSRAGKYVNSNEFPEGAVNQKLFPHAKEGWVFLKEGRRLAKEYPGELMDQADVPLLKEKDRGSFDHFYLRESNHRSIGVSLFHCSSTRSQFWQSWFGTLIDLASRLVTEANPLLRQRSNQRWRTSSRKEQGGDDSGKDAVLGRLAQEGTAANLVSTEWVYGLRE
jgi:hypothetical protein